MKDFVEKCERMLWKSRDTCLKLRPFDLLDLSNGELGILPY